MITVPQFCSSLYNTCSSCDPYTYEFREISIANILLLFRKDHHDNKLSLSTVKCSRFITAKAKFESTFQLSYISIVYLSSVLRGWAVNTQYRLSLIA